MEECETPLKDLCKQALEHYEQLAKESCHWNSLIPKAIKFYEENFVPLDLPVKPANGELTDEQINIIAKDLESDFKKKYSWLFDQLTNTYGRDSIKMLTRFFVDKLSRLSV